MKWAFVAPGFIAARKYKCYIVSQAICGTISFQLLTVKCSDTSSHCTLEDIMKSSENASQMQYYKTCANRAEVALGSSPRMQCSYLLTLGM